MPDTIAYLTLSDGSRFKGRSIGAPVSTTGELAFTTSMTGYTESVTDPSYEGQILIFTYPLIGNYGVQPMPYWESDRIHTRGVIVSHHAPSPSHWSNRLSFSRWLTQHNIPAIEIADTRLLTQLIREKGALLATITKGTRRISFVDPNPSNLVAEVSIRTPYTQGSGKKRIVLVDCGVKRNIQRLLLDRDVTLITVPYDYNPFTHGLAFDGICFSNGPGDPTQVAATIQTAKMALQRKVPTFGICLGNQVIALAAGGATYKLKFGHRGQNQPCLLEGTKRCFLTTQNHGYAVGTLPNGFRPWFTNANDGTNEGIRHTKLPVMSVQFHPEAHPGPEDTEWIFDTFLSQVS